MLLVIMWDTMHAQHEQRLLGLTQCQELHNVVEQDERAC